MVSSQALQGFQRIFYQNKSSTGHEGLPIFGQLIGKKISAAALIVVRNKPAAISSVAGHGYKQRFGGKAWPAGISGNQRKAGIVIA